MLVPNNILGPKKNWEKKNQIQKNFGLKKIWSKNILGPKNVVMQKEFWFQNFRSK